MTNPGFKTLGTKVNYLLANGFTPKDFEDMSAAQIAAALELATEELNKARPAPVEGGDPNPSTISWDMSDAVIPDTVPTEVKDLSQSNQMQAFEAKYIAAFSDNSNMESVFEFVKWAIGAFILAAV